MKRRDLLSVIDTTMNGAADRTDALASLLELVARFVRDGYVGAVEIIWCEGETPIIRLGVKDDEEAPDCDLPPGHMTFLREIPRS